MDQLSDLAGAALAEIAARGGATSYAVANAFAASPSEFWSGSAGSFYPLIKRLTAQGLLEARAGATGKRRHVEYHLTAAGRASLDHWLLDTRRAAGMGFDPLRTRLVYLDQVSSEQRATFLEAVRGHTAELADKPVFPGKPVHQKIHSSWLAARAQWLAMLDFLR
jgi:DNA-binding PadR family transcriptional regulator